MKKVLVLGGTGAIGVYLVRELLDMGYEVCVTSRQDRESDESGLTYLKGDGQCDITLKRFLSTPYDAIVDFMIYATEHFRNRYERLLAHTRHYIYLSSYRVFADHQTPIVETSPRLLDVCGDMEYLKTNEYALGKARQEDMLTQSGYTNYTIIRPTITYSKTRFQLGTLEADTLITRARRQAPVILPRDMMPKETTMTWGGDVAKMIARLLFNPAAYREDFNVCTSEHQTWETVADIYRRQIGLRTQYVDTQTYLEMTGGRYQLLYDRLYDRIMDNTKILNATGLRQNELIPLRQGLAMELQALPVDTVFRPNAELLAKMDRLLGC